MTPYLRAATQEPFSHLYNEFIRTYATTASAHHYADFTPRLREEAAHSYRQIAEAAARGEDVTEAVLLKFLPYADTESNRARGAWVHVAPAVSGDVVRWHESLGWARPEEWPQKAEAILHFVRTCVEQPERLAEACAEFSQSSYATGFQSGTLSPILNALRPNLYVTVNSRTLPVINYFANSSCSQELRDFPRANAAGLELVHILRDLESSPNVPPLRAVDRFDLFCYWLVGVRRYGFPQPRYWQIRPDGSGQWDAWRTGGFIALGYDELGDLAGMSRAEFNEVRDKWVGQNQTWTKRDVNGVWTFARRMQEGDRVVVHDGEGAVLGLGTVTGFYYFVPDVLMGHCRPVVWDDLERRGLEAGNTWRRSFSEISADQFEAILHAPPIPDRRIPQSHQADATVEEDDPQATAGVEQAPDQAVDAPLIPVLVQEAPPVYAAGRQERIALPPYPLPEVVAATGFSETQLADWVTAVERKGQAIFYGPPGTGKSFVATHLARHLVGGGDGFVEQIQFHPAYAYEDFVQGIRPVAQADGSLAYRLVPGRFMTFCREAAEHSGRCVLVIDEFNRADPARVFGEVMQLLEYREQTLVLAAGGHMRIPANVRIIATMNTADRSIALVDAALRRRFAFLALYPDYEVLRRYHARAATGFPVEALIRVLGRVNDAIGDIHYAVGITYFLRPDLATTLGAIWRTEIEPYLEEYFFDQPEQVDGFRWAQVRGVIEEA